jgi:hypothetical protein
MVLFSTRLRAPAGASTDGNNCMPNSRPGSPSLLNDDNEFPPNFPVAFPPGIDHTTIWSQVLSARMHRADLSGSSESSLSEILDFVSVSDSDDDAQPEENPDLGFDCATYGISPDTLLREDQLVDNVRKGEDSDHLERLTCLPTILAPERLQQSQRDDIGTFDFIVQNNISVKTYHGMQDRFCLRESHADLPSLKQLRTRILGLSGLKPKDYDCCKNSCYCFSGPFADLTMCPECNTPRKNAAGTSQNTFTHMSLID